MRKITLCIFAIAIAALSFTSCATVSPQSEEDDMLRAAEIAASCEDMNMQIRITQIIPKGGPHIRPHHGDFIIRIGNGTIDAYLPYIGESYSTIPGEEWAVWFQRVEYTMLKQNYDQKRGTRSFTIKAKSTDYDECELTFRIYATGRVYLELESNTLSRISYEGDFLEDKEFQMSLKSQISVAK